MSEAENQWSRLASRVARVVLARKDITYASLAVALAAQGNVDGERALVSRISRGTLKVSFLLQLIAVTAATPPARWAEVLKAKGTWEQKARAVIALEIARQPTNDFSELARRLAGLGTTVSETTLKTYATSGTMSLSLFLQLLLVLNSDSLERYVDYDDLLDAARATSVGISQ